MPPEAKNIPKVDKINRKMEMFYSALGQFNTNVITWLRTQPDKVEDITKWITIVQCPPHAEQCALLGGQYMWDEANHTCSRKPTESELPDGGGGS